MTIPKEFKGMEQSIRKQVRENLVYLREFLNLRNCVCQVDEVVQNALIHVEFERGRCGKSENCDDAISILRRCVGDLATNAFIENIQNDLAMMRMRAYVTLMTVDEAERQDLL